MGFLIAVSFALCWQNLVDGTVANFVVMADADVAVVQQC